MALTSGGFANGQGTPDKHLVASRDSGLTATGNYSDTNASGEVPDESGSATSTAAKAIFGDQSAPAAPRVAGVAAEAAAASRSDASTSSIGPAFIDGSSLGTAKDL